MMKHYIPELTIHNDNKIQKLLEKNEQLYLMLCVYLIYHLKLEKVLEHDRLQRDMVERFFKKNQYLA